MYKWANWIEGDNWQRLLAEVCNRLSFHRFEHTKRVVDVAKQLANHYKIETPIVMLAALFHDYAKELPKEQMRHILLENDREDILALAPAIWHAPVGAYLIKDIYPFGEDIFDSICYHTTGRNNMTDIEKVTFLADYIEPKRSYPRLDEIRKEAWINLDYAMYMALNLNLEKLIINDFLVAEVTVEARNYFLTKRSVSQ